MPLSEAERQKRYRAKKATEGLKRFQVMLPRDISDQISALCTAQNCTKSELFRFLVENFQDGSNKKIQAAGLE